jgi:hypothetical protein
MPVDPHAEDSDRTLKTPADQPSAPPDGSAKTPAGALPATLVPESLGSAAPVGEISATMSSESPLAAPVNDPTLIAPPRSSPSTVGEGPTTPMRKAGAPRGLDVEGTRSSTSSDTAVWASSTRLANRKRIASSPSR